MTHNNKSGRNTKTPNFCPLSETMLPILFHSDLQCNFGIYVKRIVKMEIQINLYLAHKLLQNMNSQEKQIN